VIVFSQKLSDKYRKPLFKIDAKQVASIVYTKENLPVVGLSNKIQGFGKILCSFLADFSRIGSLSGDWTILEVYIPKGHVLVFNKSEEEVDAMLQDLISTCEILHG